MNYKLSVWGFPKNYFFVYLVRPDWPGCTLLPACPSRPPRSSHLPAMKGSPVRTTSEPGWTYESSLKGRIEVLRSIKPGKEKKKREIKIEGSSRKRQKEEKIIGGDSGKRRLSWLKQCSHTMKLWCSASKISSKVIKLLKCTMTITQVSPKPSLFCLPSRAWN